VRATLAFQRQGLEPELLAIDAHTDLHVAAFGELSEQQFFGERPLDLSCMSLAIGRAPIFGS
jgi:hypothetical protein